MIQESPPKLHIKAGKNTELTCPHCGEALLWWIPPGTDGDARVKCCKCKQEVVFEVRP